MGDSPRAPGLATDQTVDASTAATGPTLAESGAPAPRDARDAAVAATLRAGERGDALAPTLAAATSAPGPIEGALTASVTSLDAPVRYEVGEELGRGGIGRVVSALDRALGREVALKELLEAASDGGVSTAAVARFLREARVTARLEHPGIVPVHELGRRAGGALYYTMKRVRGRSLARVLGEARTLEERLRSLRAFRDVCDAVAYAHARGVVHRDLKPDNVMIGAFGETVVLDWGIAKVLGAADDDAAVGPASPPRAAASGDDALRTADGAAMGTPSYMSPEQARGAQAEIDERADVWGLGAMLFEILTGEPPFSGRTVLEVLAKVLSDEPPRVLSREPSAPPELAAIADRALCRDRADRYRSARELAEEVGAYLDGRAVRAYEYSSVELLRRFVRRNRAATVASALVVAAAVAAAVFSFGRYRAERSARAEAESRRAEAEEARAALAAESEATSRALSEALVERAERALLEHDPVLARIYGAAALERPPAAEPEAALDHGVLARARSALLAAAEIEHWELVERTPLGAIEPTFVPSLAASDDGAVVGYGRPGGAVFVRDGAVTAELAGDVFVGGLVRGGTAFVDAGEARAVRALDGTVLFPLPEAPGGRHAVTSAAGVIVLGTATGWLVVLDEDGHERGRVPLGGDARYVRLDRAGRVASALTFSPARHVVVALDDGGPRVVLEETRASRPSSTAVAPSGAWVAVAGYPEPIRVSSLPDGEPLSSHGAAGAMAQPLDDEAYLSFVQSFVEIVDARSGEVRERLALPVRRTERTVARAVRGEIWAVLSSPATDHDAVLARWARVPARPVLEHDLGVPVVDVAATRDRVVVLSANEMFEWRGGSRALAAVPASLGRPGEASLSTMILSSDGGLAVRTFMGEIRVQAPDGPAFRVLRAPRAPEEFMGVELLPDGRLAAAGADGSVEIWSVARGELERRVEGLHAGAILSLARSHDGRRLVTTGEDGRACLHDASTLEALGCLDGHAILASRAAFSPDDATLATADGAGWVRLLDAATLEERTRFRAHQEWVNSVVWSPDGTLLLTASDDGSGLYDAASGAPLRVFDTAATIGVAFLDEGALACTTRRTRIECYEVASARAPIDPAAARLEAERRAGRRLVGFELVAGDASETLGAAPAAPPP